MGSVGRQMGLPGHGRSGAGGESLTCVLNVSGVLEQQIHWWPTDPALHPAEIPLG